MTQQAQVTSRKVELTQEKAAEMGAAWYANQSPQDVAGYNALGGTDTEACANCLFFMSPNGCTVVESWPVAISPTGLSKFWTAIPTYRPEPMEVIIVDRAEVQDKEQGVMARAWEAFKAMFDHEYRLDVPTPAPQQEAVFEIKGPTGLQLFKDVTGAWRWFAWVSNKFRDRDGEIIEDKAHREFVAYLDEGGVMPEAWLWHTPGTKWGQADWADYADGFLTMSGTVDVGSEAVAESLAKEAVGVSHGFQLTYSAKDTIGWYRSFEISALPPSAAANAWTSLELVRKEAAMSFSPTKRAYLEGKLGLAKTDELERGTGDLSKALADLGVDYKDIPEEPVPARLTEKEVKDIAEATMKAITESGPVKALTDSVVALDTKVEQGLKGFDERLKALEMTDADKVADYFKARVAPGAVERASQSTKNIVTEGELEQVTKAAPSFEWLEKAL